MDPAAGAAKEEEEEAAAAAGEEKDEEADSLFAGMEFVIPGTLEAEGEGDVKNEEEGGATASATPEHSSAAPALEREEVAEKDTAAPPVVKEVGSVEDLKGVEEAKGEEEVAMAVPQKEALPGSLSSGSRVLSGPLDETLFTGLSMSAEEAAAAIAAEGLAEGAAEKEEQVKEGEKLKPMEAVAAGKAAEQALNIPRTVSHSSADSRDAEEGSSVLGGSVSSQNLLGEEGLTQGVEAGASSGGAAVRLPIRKKKILGIGIGRGRGGEVLQEQGSSAGSPVAPPSVLSPGDLLSGVANFSVGAGLPSEEAEKKQSETVALRGNGAAEMHVEAAAGGGFPGGVTPVVSDEQDTEGATASGTTVAEDAATEGDEDKQVGGERAEPLPAAVAKADEPAEAPAAEELGAADEAATEDLSLEEQLEKIMERVNADVEAWRRKVAELSAQRKLATQRRRQLAQKALTAAAKRRELEEKMAEASEQEDFERADQLSQEMEGSELEAEAVAAEARAAEAECEEIAAKVQDAEDRELRAQEEAVQRVRDLQQEWEGKATELREKAEGTAASTLEQVGTEEELLAARKRKLHHEQRLLDEEEQELQAKVDVATQEERKEKEALLEGRQGLEAALEALREQLRAKEAEIASQDERIAAVDEQIAVVGSKFEKLRRELEVERARVDVQREEVTKEEARLGRERREVEEEVQSAEEKGARLKEVASGAGRAAEEMQQRVDGQRAMREEVAAGRARRDELAAREKEVLDSAQGLREAAGGCRQTLQGLAATRNKLQQELDSAQQRIEHAQKRGPELEGEKKQAASARNFKEAARLAAEAKLLANDKEAAAAEVSFLKAEMKKLEEEEKEQAAQAMAAERELVESDKEAAKIRCERLRLIADSLRREMDSAAEAEDFEEAESLNAEAEAADEEADGLQKQFELAGAIYSRVEERGSEGVQSTSGQEVDAHAAGSSEVLENGADKRGLGPEGEESGKAASSTANGKAIDSGQGMNSAVSVDHALDARQAGVEEAET